MNLSPKTDPLYVETIAGRRFLEALRQNHKNDGDESTVQTVKIASFDFGLKPKDDVNELKRKRMTLRASLEELLVEYLRGLTPDGNQIPDDRSRVKRSVTNAMNNQNSNENIDTENVRDSSVREENGVRNNDSVDSKNEIDATNQTSNSSQTICAEQQQRITQLDRNELTAAIQNVSEHEHNIRRQLNYRYFNWFWCFIIKLHLRGWNFFKLP